MKSLITTSLFTRLPDSGLLGEIVYIPKDEHIITPTVDGKPK